MGTAEVLVGVLSLASVCVTSYTAWKLRIVQKQLNGVRAELRVGDVKEGELRGRDEERRRQRGELGDRREEALERGRERMERIRRQVEDDPARHP